MNKTRPLHGGYPTAEDDGSPCTGDAHCCCCGPGEPCCDCGKILPDPLADLRAKMRMIVSHATGGACQDIDLSTNAIAVLITQKVNIVYHAGRAAALEEAALIAEAEKRYEGSDFPVCGSIASQVRALAAPANNVVECERFSLNAEAQDDGLVRLVVYRTTDPGPMLEFKREREFLVDYPHAVEALGTLALAVETVRPKVVGQ